MADPNKISSHMNILSLDYRIFKALCEDLDIDSKFRDLICCAEDTIYQLNDVEIESCAKVLHRAIDASPSTHLLMKWGNMGMTVDQLSHFLDMLRLERCLMLICPPKQLVITIQPKKLIVLEEGCTLEIICEATGFPYPQYVWYKEKEKVFVDTQGKLTIRNAKLSDKGRYCCRVQHQYADPDNNDKQTWHHTASNFCTVDVKPFTRPQIYDNNSHKPVLTPSVEVRPIENCRLSNPMFDLKISDNYHNTETQSSLTYLPQILVQPTPQTNSIGGIAFFKVEARHADSRLCYQWYHNQKPIKGATKNELQVSITGFQDAGDYQVRVYTSEKNSQEALSRLVKLEVKPIPNQFTAGDKVALIIGISTYRSYGQPLPAVENDLKYTVQVLEKMGFKVVSLIDLTLVEMNNAVEMFCDLLSSEVYGIYVFQALKYMSKHVEELDSIQSSVYPDFGSSFRKHTAIFYCIGHGFIYNSQHYLIPWDACQGTDLRESLCIETAVNKIQKKNPKLLMLLVDVCRKNVEHLNQPPVTQQTTEMFNQRSPPNKITIYAASIGEQSFEESKKNTRKRPRCLFNQYLLKVLEQEDLTVMSVFQALQDNFRSCPYDRDVYPQHPEMTINLKEPERSLWDPIDTIKYDELIKTRTSRWERAHTLPPDVTIQLPPLGSIHVTFHRVASNVMNMVATANLTQSQLRAEISILMDEIDQVLKPVRTEILNEQKIQFQFPNLQRLKRKMIIRLLISLYNISQPGTRYQFPMNPIDLDRPLVACFGLDEPPASTRIVESNRQPMEHTEDSQSSLGANVNE